VSVYLIAEINVCDVDLYSQYVEQAPAIIQKYGGEYLVKGGDVVALSGNWNPERMVLVKFPSMEKLQSCFKSKEYLDIAHLREKSTTSKAILLQGVS